MTGPGDNTTAVEGRRDGRHRASHADREQVIGIIKTAFVQGRLTEDELDARVGQVYASRTYAELAEVTADIPTELTGARPPRDPWRATKVAWEVVYAPDPARPHYACCPPRRARFLSPSGRWSPCPRSSMPFSGFSAFP